MNTRGTSTSIIPEDVIRTRQKFRNINDIRKIADDQTLNSIMANEISDKTLPVIIDYFQRLFINPIVIPKSQDFFNYRIQRFVIWNKGFQKNFKLDMELCPKILIPDQYRFWLSFSNKVLKKESVNFPILYCYSKKSNIGYFENFSLEIYDRIMLELLDIDTFDQVLFQELLILYTLYVNNLSSVYYKFQTFRIPKTRITFKVEKLEFKFDLNILVILCPSTEIIDVPSIEVSYLDFLGLKDNKFISFFIKRFIKNINLDTLLVNNTVLNTFTQPIRTIRIGDIVVVRQGNSSALGIISEILNELCSVMIVSVNNKNITIAETLQNINNLFSVGEVYNIERGLIIGPISGNSMRV